MSIKKIPSVDLLTKTDKHQHHLANKIVFVTYQIHLAPLCLLKEGKTILETSNIYPNYDNTYTTKKNLVV